MQGLLATSFICLTSAASLADDLPITFKKLSEHTPAYMKSSNVVCRRKADYRHFMNLAADDRQAALSFLKPLLKIGQCKGLDEGTPIIVDDLQISEPVAFHIKGDPTTFFIFLEGIEAR